MNKLPAERRSAIIRALVEGNSVRATARITGAAKGTILRLLAEIGEACWSFHDKTVRDLTCKRIQCDEIWSFCYSKERNVPAAKLGSAGDIWTRSEEHTSELQSQSNLVCRLLLEKKK